MKKIILGTFMCILYFILLLNVSAEWTCKYSEWDKYWQFIKNFTVSNNWDSYTYIAESIDLSKGTTTKKLIKDWVEIGKGYVNPNDFSYSPDWKSFSFIWFKDEKEVFVKDWKVKEWVTWWKYWYVGNNFTYVRNKNDKDVIIQDWKVIVSDYDTISNFIISENWENFSFIWTKNNKRFIVKNWKIIEGFNKPADLTYTDDWNSLMFTERLEKGDIVLLNDGKIVSWEYENINEYYVSFDWLSIIIDGEKKWIDSYFHNWNNVDLKDEQSYKSEPIFSVNGKNYVYTFSDDSYEKYISYNWKVIDEWININHDIWFSPKWELYYTIDKDGNSIFKLWWKTFWKEYHNIWLPLYSPDGKSFSFGAKKDDKYIVIKDEKQIWWTYDRATRHHIYSADGKSFSFVWYKNGKQIVIKDGKEVWDIFLDITEIKYKSNNEIIYTVYDGKSFIVNEKCENTHKIISSETNNSITIKSKSKIFKNLILSQKELKIKKYWNGLIIKLNPIVSNMTDKKLLSVYRKLIDFNTNWSNVIKYKSVFLYLEAKIGIEIHQRGSINKEIIK
jgi:hypothetical protein